MTSSSQEKLISLLKEGKIQGENIKPTHIEMPVSNVFIFEEKVYKIYKNDNEYVNNNFRDVSAKKDRFAFTREDFAWNHKLNKDIYVEIRGIKAGQKHIEFVDEKNAEELIIIMKKIDTNHSLPLLMIDEKLSQKDYYNIGVRLAKSLLTIEGVQTEKKIDDVMRRRMNDVKSWVDSLNDGISELEKNKSFKILDIKFKDYLKEASDLELGTCCDNQMENIIYDNNILYIMDSYHFKDAWMIADKSTNFYRLATDILALAGKDSFDNFKKGFLSIAPNYINQKNEDFFIYYSAMIMWPYMFMLKTEDKKRLRIAKKYHKFMMENYIG